MIEMLKDFLGYESTTAMFVTIGIVIYIIWLIFFNKRKKTPNKNYDLEKEEENIKYDKKENETTDEKSKTENMLSEKLSEIENEDKEILRELDENIKALEPVEKFLKELDETIKKEYDKHKIPDDYLSRRVEINVPMTQVYAGGDIRNEFDKRPSLQFNIICKGGDSWAVVRKEYKLDDTFTSERFEGIDNLYNYLRELITDLVAEDISYNKPLNKG